MIVYEKTIYEDIIFVKKIYFC